MDSPALKALGDILIIKLVLLFPPILSCNSRVSFESRYGIWLVFGSVSALITLPKEDSDLLICLA
jgi:hypothetical protein